MRPGRGQYLPGRRKTGKGACRTAGDLMQKANERFIYKQNVSALAGFAPTFAL